MTLTAQRPAPPGARTPLPDQEEPRARAGVLRTPAAAFLASSGAGWMTGGLFKGVPARLVGVLGALIGAGVVALSYRTRRPAVVQYLALPAALLSGALLVLPDARAGADVPALVSEALRAGGLAQPPLPFDPGWRFVLVVLCAVVAAGAASIAIGLDRPNLAVAVPVPVILGAALIQPPSGEVVSSAVAMALVLAGLAVSYGGELAADGTTTGGGFELKRLGRGVALLGALVVAIAGVSKARFLFPETAKERVVPPTRPAVSAPQPDRALFRAFTPSPGPWRLGVLDVYDGLGWLFPPYDPSRLLDVAGGDVADPRIRIDTSEGTSRTRFEILALQGRTLPSAAGSIRVEGRAVQYDPRTQALRLPDVSARAGLAYTVEAASPPGGAALADAPAPPSWARAFTEAPPPPNEVVALLRRAPDANLWDRLQFVRARLYRRVVAAGAGTPVDVPPARAVELLNGGEGTPWEITATEALLARWAGVPARIGYGFYGGDRTGGAPFAEVHPRHGATWLEVYVEGHGWVPVVGVPPRARSSLSPDEQNRNPNVRPTDELALIVHVPIRLSSVQLLYVTIRYWVGVAIPLIAGISLLWWALPGFLKGARRARRARWARARGPAARIAASYADLRDRAHDLGIGAHALTPLHFADLFEPDDEHHELAWLVTRALWGDLTRDLRAADSATADELARSVARRMARAQPATARVFAFGARGSLRDPYAPGLPNAWPAWLDRRPVRSFVRARVRSMRTRWRARRLARATAALLVLVALGSCARGFDPAARFHAGTLPDPVTPATAGDVTLRREPKAEKAYATVGEASLIGDGRVYTLRRGDVIEGYLQAMALKPSVDVEDPLVRNAVLRSISGGRFALRRLGDLRVWTQDLPEQRILAWFTPDAAAMYLQVTRRAYEGADATFLDVVRAVEGTAGGTPKPLPTYDPRMGGEA